ncbi:DUF6318 family protein [uncultured Arthrobacter sp.]|uniref:DUF6318 family protein n=1 Tax=uncultured Arthrobacter sp. TaxID=114050 RepID=UPI0026024F9F|nr:DUF6318 family protein [uncultured Arthrobacter sp.]
MKTIKIAATAAVALAVLTGCGESTESAATPSNAAPTPASSTAPAQNVAEPAVNDLMSEPTAEGAKAFLHHVFQLKSYAQQTGDVEPLLASLDGAEAAVADAEAIKARYDDGGWILGGQPKVKQILITTEADEVAEGVEVNAMIPVNPDAYTAFNEAGEAEETRPFDPAGSIYSATVVYSDGAWKATYLEETPDAELPAAE